jgi:hypothetical protein
MIVPSMWTARPSWGHRRASATRRFVSGCVICPRPSSARQPSSVLGGGYPASGPDCEWQKPVMVLGRAPTCDVVTDVPTIVIEVLSTNRTDDLVRKSTEYLAAGARQYWIVDPQDRVFDVFQQSATGWERIAQRSARSTACYACGL